MGSEDPSISDSRRLLPTKVPRGTLQGKRLSAVQLQKVDAIIDACEDSSKLDLVIALATSPDGLIDDGVRRIAWPLLLNYDSKQLEARSSQSSWQDLPVHRDEGQVELDVNRSFIYYPKSMDAPDILHSIVADSSTDESEKQLDRRKEELSSIIIQVLRRHSMLSYFQGFHDIVQVFLLVLGADFAAQAVTRLSLLRIRDFMLPSLVPSLSHLKLLPAILQAVDIDLCRHLSQTQPFFALAATLTLYAHDIQEYGDIARLFDFLIAQPAVVSIYFFATIILSRREELFDVPADEPEMLHSILSKLPKPLDLEALISTTILLFDEHPPEDLPDRAWENISPYSVLKTTRTPERRDSIQDGEAIFELQVLQLRRQEYRERAMIKLWKYRRPVGGLGLAVVVGLMSIWLGRRGFEGIPLLGAQRLARILRPFR